MWRIGLALLFATLTGVGPAQAGSALQVMDSRGDMLGWEAVGRVDLNGKGYCTGVLIAPDQVLTAAHCLFDDAGRPLETTRARFRAGYLNGEALVDRKVSKYLVAEGYEFNGPKLTLEEAAKDVALLKLEYPIYSSEADPFLVHDGNTPVEHVQVMSYGRGRDEAMSWQRRCGRLHATEELMFFDCDITFGSSGAPVFVRYGNRVRILSLVSGFGTANNGQDYVIGMQLPKMIARLRARMRNSDAPVAKVGSGARRITTGGENRTSGAKFLKVN